MAVMGRSKYTGPNFGAGAVDRRTAARVVPVGPSVVVGFVAIAGMVFLLCDPRSSTTKAGKAVR